MKQPVIDKLCLSDLHHPHARCGPSVFLLLRKCISRSTWLFHLSQFFTIQTVQCLQWSMFFCTKWLSHFSDYTGCPCWFSYMAFLEFTFLGTCHNNTWAYSPDNTVVKQNGGILSKIGLHRGTENRRFKEIQTVFCRSTSNTSTSKFILAKKKRK